MDAHLLRTLAEAALAAAVAGLTMALVEAAVDAARHAWQQRRTQHR